MVIVVERTLLQPATGAGGIMVILHVMDVVEMEKKIVMVVVPQEKSYVKREEALENIINIRTVQCA